MIDEQKKKSEFSKQESNLPITSSDALPLSYRRLEGAKAIKIHVDGFMLQTSCIHVVFTFY